jgi:DegV family protein with EDD domain
MAHAVAIVTDSTATIAASEGLQVVPITVHIGARSGADLSEITSDDIADALRDRESVTTSRPPPSALEALYRKAFASGAERVVSVHISAELSGTWDSAVLAAQEFDYGRVRVVDSRSTAMGLGFAVLAAAEAAASGASASQVQDAAVATVDRTSCFFYVDSLDHLRRGGRIGSAQALFGTALSMKPLLHLLNGRLVALEKVRTATKALSRLSELAIAAAGDGPVDIAVQHFAAPERVDEVADGLRARLPGLATLTISEVGAAVGAHTGPGTVGIVVCRR